MMKTYVLKAIFVFALFSVTHFINGQPTETPIRESAVKPPVKPFKVLTNGKQITVQSKQNLKSLIVWTASGHRIVEEKDLQTTSYSFSVPAKEKVVYLMVVTAEGKKFTEKMGVK
jgi:hypothetical protein